MDLGLKNKVAMVGGASKGLGYAVARALAGEGAQVSIASRDAAAIGSAAATISRETGSKVFSLAADLSTGDAIERWHAATLEQFGGVDLLFANTGGPPAGMPLSFDDNAWHAASSAGDERRPNRAPRRAIDEERAAAGDPDRTSSSVKSRFPIWRCRTSCGSAVSSFAKSLSLELASDKIRVNTLIPGRIATDRLKYLDEANAKKAGISTDEQQKRALSTVPMGRYGDPDEFGRAGAFLLSDAASYITGAAIQVDGGLIKGLL
jgi:3-oxoacyl-[acyl-carrier protein] reductase